MNRRAFLGLALTAAAARMLDGRGARAAPDATFGMRRGSAPRPWIVAGTVSRSGRFAPLGVPAERAARTWAERLDSAAGLAGRRVLLRLEDDRSDPDEVRARYPSLAHEADVLLAPYGSALTRWAIEAAERVGVPLLAPTAGDAELWAAPRRWSVQVLNPTGTMLHETVQLAARHGLSSVGFLHRDDPFSRQLVSGAVTRAEALDLRVAERRTFSSERGARRAAAGMPGELLVATGYRPGGRGAGFLDDARLLYGALRAAGVRPRMLSLGIGAADEAFARELGPDADGALGTTGWRPYLPTPGSERFARAYRDRWGELPDTHAAQAYAALELYARAVEGGESRDAPPHLSGEGRGRNAERARVRDALFDMDVETVFGRYRVDAHGRQVGKTNAVVQWQEGRPVVLAPERYRTGALAGAADPPLGTPATAPSRPFRRYS